MFRELDDSSSAVAFPNVRGSFLTRDGVNYILQQAGERASASYPSLKNKRVFPHIFRHSCALHLLQSERVRQLYSGFYCTPDLEQKTGVRIVTPKPPSW